MAFLPLPVDPDVGFPVRPDTFPYTPVEGLKIGGLLCDNREARGIKEIATHTEAGILWIRGLLATTDVPTEQPCTITFITLYPVNLPLRWIVADFISWIVTHEMMEGVSLGGHPLYQAQRLTTDHAHWWTKRTVIEAKLQRARQRFYDDQGSYRWEQDKLFDAARLRIDP